MAKAKKNAKKKASKKNGRSTKKKAPRKKKAAKKKASKKKGAKKKRSSVTEGMAASAGARAEAMMVAPRHKAWRTKKIEALYDRFTRKKVRDAALKCVEVGHCRIYIDEMLDGLDIAFAEWQTMKADIANYKHAGKVMVDALDDSEKEIAKLKKKLTAARKAKKVGVADTATIESMLKAQADHLKSLKRDIKAVAKKAGVTLKMRAGTKRAQVRVKPPKRKPAKAKKGRLAKHTPASGAGCSLAGARYGYSGKVECAPDGFGPREAGRRLANLRHHGVAFNPEDYFEMGYEAALAEGSGAAPKKRAPAKKNAGKRRAPAKAPSRRAAHVPAANSNPAPDPGLVARQKRTLRRLGL